MKISSLYSESYRLIGSGIALAGIAIFLMLLIADYQFIENWEQKILTMNHYIIVLGLVLLVYSREKAEDERIRDIRHWMLRFSYMLTVAGILLYAAISILDRVDFNLYVIFYILEASLILYQILFRLFLRTNPPWIFREAPPNRITGIIPVAALLFLIVWLVWVIIHYKV